MADNYVKEFLTTGTGTEGTLLIPRFIATLVGEVDKRLIPRSEAAEYYGPDQIPGSSIEINKVTVDKMDVRTISEGSEVPIDASEYSNSNVKPKKYGVSIRITSEMMEDSKFNLLDHNLRIAGKRFAENENTLVVTALDTASNTVSGGAAITIANITRAMQYLEDSDYEPTTFVVGNEVLNDLRNIDTFVEFQKVGNTDMLSKGFLGNIYGMNVVRVSTNAGMTATSSYVFDRGFGYVIAEKRRITVENVSFPTFDMEGAVITQRITVAALRSASVAKITTS